MTDPAPREPQFGKSAKVEVAMSQLKYSTRRPDKAWTVARLCEQRRKRRLSGAVGAPRSVIADLAWAYRQPLDDQGTDTAAKSTIALVTNQPGDDLLVRKFLVLSL
jgi:hypothetical protein